MRHQIMDVILYLEHTATKYVNTLCLNMTSNSSKNSTNIYLFKVSNRDTRKGCEICSK